MHKRECVVDLRSQFLTHYIKFNYMYTGFYFLLRQVQICEKQILKNHFFLLSNWGEPERAPQLSNGIHHDLYI